jgi:hypothetical protein
MVLGRFSDIKHFLRHTAHHIKTTFQRILNSTFRLRTATARLTSLIIFIQIFAFAYHTTPALARRLFHDCYNGKGFNSPLAAAIRAKGKLIESIPLCKCIPAIQAHQPQNPTAPRYYF